MHFTKFAFVSLASLAIGSPLSNEAALEERAGTKPNNANITIANCIDIGNKIHTLNKTLNDFYPGSPHNNTKTGLIIEQQSITVNNALKNATTYVQLSHKWGENDTYNVAVAFLDHIVGQTHQLLDKLISKNHTFKNNVKGLGDTRPRVKVQLLNQKLAAGKFGNATANHLTADFADPARSISADIQAHFDRAIEAFSGTD